jgi:Ca-activated chloride channel family protein
LGGQALTFGHPWLLLLLLLIPALAWLRGRFGPRAAIVFSATAPFRAIGKSSASRAGQILRALVWLTLATFIIGIARPQLGKSLTQVEASGIDIMFPIRCWRKISPLAARKRPDWTLFEK